MTVRIQLKVLPPEPVNFLKVEGLETTVSIDSLSEEEIIKLYRQTAEKAIERKKKRAKEDVQPMEASHG